MNNITCVLNVAEECRKTPNVEYYNYLHLKLDDVPSEKIECGFADGIGFICRCLLNNKGVLVHCYAGISRSATIVIAFLIFSGYGDYRQTRMFVKERRPIISPNEGFSRKLKRYEMELMEATSVVDIKRLIC